MLLKDPHEKIPTIEEPSSAFEYCPDISIEPLSDEWENSLKSNLEKVFTDVCTQISGKNLTVPFIVSPETRSLEELLTTAKQQVPSLV